MHWLAALSPLALAAGCPQRHRECSPREGQFGVRKTNAVTRRDLSEGHPPTGTNGPEKDNWQAQKRPMHARAQASAHPGARALALTPRGSGVPAASWVGQRGANARTHTHTHDALTHIRTHTHTHTHAHTHRLGERRICLRKAHRFALLERQRHLVHARHGQVERLTTTHVDSLISQNSPGAPKRKTKSFLLQKIFLVQNSLALKIWRSRTGISSGPFKSI